MRRRGLLLGFHDCAVGSWMCRGREDRCRDRVRAGSSRNEFHGRSRHVCSWSSSRGA